MITPTWDTLFLFMLVGFGILGFVLRSSKTAPLLVGMYVSLAVTSEIGLEIFRFLRRSEIGGFDSSLFLVRVVIFVVLTFLLFLEGDVISPAGEGGNAGADSVKGGIWGLLAGAITITTIVHFMGATDQNQLLAKSTFISALMPWRVWLLVPFPIMLAVGSLLKRFR